MIKPVSLAGLKRILAFISHWFSSKTRHGTHSPFVYALVDQCLYQKMEIPSRIRAHFDDLKRIDEHVSGVDYGKGEEVSYSIGQLARQSASRDFEAETLAKLVNYHRFQNILELGGNLGKAATYMASVNSECQIVSVEGNEGLAQYMSRSLKNLDLKNVAVVHNTFDAFFKENQTKFDMVFIDGDHSYEPTLRYFEHSKKILNGPGPIVLHDIYWSRGMTEAWERIKADETATVTIDLFFFGLVYFRPEQRKQHFSIRYPMPLIRAFF